MLRVTCICLLLTFIPNILSTQHTHNKNLEKYRKSFLPEKVFLHTDKDIYAAGETIWGSVYLVDGQTHKSSSFSKTIYVSLVDSKKEVISTIKVFANNINEPISLELPRKIPSGTYQLQAYTNYQQNSGLSTLFSKSISIVLGKQPESISSTPIINKTDSYQENPSKINLQFFPEGGDCVAGLVCRMALVAQDYNKHPIELSGEVVDQKGRVVTIFKTNDRGMGELTFIPNSKTGYSAIVKNRKSNFPLPNSIDEGYTLQIYRRSGDITLHIQTNVTKGLKDAKIVVHHRGLPFIEETLSILEPKTIIPIKEEDLIPGIYVATLFDTEGNEVAERLFFDAPDDKTTELNITLDQQEITPRQDIEMSISNKINLPIENDSLLNSSISLSVVPAFAASTSTEDIRTWLLLNSDLDVAIKDAKDILFSSSTYARDYLIDQFLMTRAWRRFRWKKLSNKESFQAKFKLEKGLYINGSLSLSRNKKLHKGKVFLNQIDHDIHEESITDDNGDFSFGPYILYDTSTFVLQGRFKKGKKKRKANANISFEDSPFVDILIKSRTLPQLLLSPIHHTLTLANKGKQYEQLSTEMFNLDPINSLLSVDLGEVSISAKRINQKEEQRKKRTRLYKIPSFRLDLDENPTVRNATSFLDLAAQIPGVFVMNGRITISGGGSRSEPLIVIDGQVVTQEDLQFIPLREIEFIDVLKFDKATMYGARGGTGVMLIYTAKRLDWEEDLLPPTPGLETTEIIGYHLAREFSSIDSPADEGYATQDIRTTLYWNPNLKLKNKETLKEGFITSGKTGKFIIVAQGIRNNGVPLYGSLAFEVK